MEQKKLVISREEADKLLEKVIEKHKKKMGYGIEIPTPIELIEETFTSQHDNRPFWP